METNVMIMNLTPGSYDVFYDGAIQNQISEKFVCPLAIFHW